jgi:hypothetical protein
MMRILQLLLDKRQPFFIPYYALNTIILKRKISKVSKPNKIYVSLTFDLENNWGNEEQNCQDENIQFIEKIQRLIKLNGTYFITGNLVFNLSKGLKQLAKRNEIGLHGYRHELWKPAHFVDKRAIRDSEKKKLLENSLSEFERSGLDRPFSFRAPYMWCKNADFKLLEEMGFKMDSSDRSQNGMFKIRKKGKILKIPVTANPFPYFKKKGVLIFAKFRLFNLKILNELQDTEFCEYINQILRMQIFQKSIPHLVFLAHPWEFYGRGELEKDENYNHRGVKNYNVLKTKLRLLEKQYDVKYVTINQLKELYEMREQIY